ncbi:hypothetical protein DSLPV1_044 [Dishui lake phycodnavirus 1]|uniref:hypothetical protein n=1 Tax=Dishui lake phycodnavirus 1 TaxID=2079134 RepID=UPI000CD681A5|nr:hypothetical protein C5Y57_gp044 [Dishui lake phycodnavirus 1]AUT19015.1 hypothetical protein DSLPV1_044 [Dishui lake phycodnavirus 1]
MRVPTCGRCHSYKDALQLDHPACLHHHVDACKRRPFELMFEAFHAPKCLNYLYGWHIQIGLTRLNYDLGRTRHAAST